MQRPVLLYALLCAACARTPPPAVSPPPPQGTGSPAAAFCEQEGGQPDVFTDPQGNQYGMCRLADGRVVEEWEYLRGSRPATNKTRR